MIRKWILGRRFQNAAIRSNHFMAHHPHLGQQIEAPNYAVSTGSQPGPTCAQLKQLLKARRARADFFGAHLFADPAWDILLLAYVALLEQDRLLISTLCRTIITPATTSLRWIKALETEGWIVQRDDPMDRSRAWLELSTAGKIGMERYLTAVWPSVPL